MFSLPRLNFLDPLQHFVVLALLSQLLPTCSASSGRRDVIWSQLMSKEKPVSKWLHRRVGNGLIST